jgi:MFS family permease
VSARFGPNFAKVFAAALLQEMSFFLLVNFPGYLETLGITESLIGVLYAGGAVLALLFRPALGRILDLTPRRTVLLVTGLLNAAVVLALAFTTVWGPLL